jgi:hypothetical protein
LTIFVFKTMRSKCQFGKIIRPQKNKNLSWKTLEQKIMFK